MTTYKKSIVLSFVGQYIEILITFISSIIISRLLSPEEIGLFSVVVAISVIAHMIRDFGAGSYLITKEIINEGDKSAAFFINIMTSWLSAFLLFILSDSIALWLEILDASFVVKLIAINFLIIPFGAVRLALIRRDMRFDQYVVINTTSAFILACVSVILAFSGYGYFSLIYGSLCGTAVTVVLACYFYPNISMVRPSLHDMKSIVVFGGKVTFINIIDSLSVPFYEGVCTKFLGVTNNGLFSKSRGVIQLFDKALIEGLVPVLLPHFSKMTSKEELFLNYRNIVTHLAAVCWPILAVIFVLAEPILTLLFGEQWGGASVYLKWYVVINAIAILYVYSSQLLISQNLLNEQIVYKLISLLVSFSVAYYAALNQSITLFMVAILIQVIIELVASSFVIVSYCRVNLKFFLYEMVNPLFLSALVFLLCEFLWSNVPSTINVHIWMIICGLISILFWMFIALVFRNKTFLLIRKGFFT